MTISMRKALAALAALLATAPAVASTALCDAGPPRINGEPARVWHGDFDGDGRIDRLWLLPPGHAPRLNEMASDPWTGFRRRFEPRAQVLVIAHGRHCSLIQKPRFFATPIWQAAEPPLSILPRSSPARAEWPRFSRRWRGDGVLLGTEAGVDVLLYLDGRRWRIGQRPEEP